MSNPTRLTIRLKRKRSSEHEPEPESAPSASQVKVEDPKWQFTGSFADDGSGELLDEVLDMEAVKPDPKNKIQVDEDFQAKICKEFGIGGMNQVGKGGFGVVFSYSEEKLPEPSASSKKTKTSEAVESQKRAIKVIPFRYKSEERLKIFHRQVKRELFFMRKLKDNANIIQLLDYKWIPAPDQSIARMHMAIKTEWLDCSLEDILDVCEALPQEQMSEIVGPITSAIAWMHENCIVHHDIKPSNIMLHPFDLTKPFEPQLVTCQKKVIDFGVSRMYPGQPETAKATRHRSGTSIYFSPQKLHLNIFQEYEPYLADSYALGMTFAEMLISFDRLDDALNGIDANGNSVPRRAAQQIVQDFIDKCENVFKKEHLNAVKQLVRFTEKKRIHPKTALKMFQS